MAESSQFKKDFISGAAYTTAAKYANIIVSILVAAVLARLLTPQDFATITVATIIIGFFALLTTSGLGPAIIQDKNLSENDVNHIYSFTVYMSALATLTFVLCSPLLGYIYQDDQLTTISLWLSCNLFFSLLNTVPNALLFKNKRFKYIAVRTVAVQVALGGVSIAGALLGLGIYALLINPVAGSALIYIINYRCYPVKFSFKIDFDPVKRIVPYSLYQISFNILNYFYRSIDKLLIGRYLGMAQLGYYEKSYRLMMMPLDNIANVITPVMHPLLSEYKDNIGFIVDKYSTITRYFAYAGFTVSVICFFCAKEIILIMFGAQWVASIPVFKIFSLSIGIQLVQSAVGAIYQSTGHVKQLFQAGLLAFICMIIAIALGIISKQLVVLAWYILAAFTVIFFIYHYILIKRVLKVSLVKFLSTLVRPILTAAIIALTLFCSDFFITTGNIIVSLIIKISLSIVCIIILQETNVIRGIPSIRHILSKSFSHVRNR